MPVTHDDMERSHARLVEVSEELARDSTERKESDRRTATLTRWAITLTIIDTLALVFVVLSVIGIRDVQAQSTARGKNIVAQNSSLIALSRENHETLVILKCALSSGNDHPGDPVGQRAALNACVEAGTK